MWNTESFDDLIPSSDPFLDPCGLFRSDETPHLSRGAPIQNDHEGDQYNSRHGYLFSREADLDKKAQGA